MSTPHTMSCNVLPNERVIMLLTASLVRSLSPRLPCAASPSQRPYCSTIGSCRCSFWRICSAARAPVFEDLTLAVGSNVVRTAQNARNVAIRITGIEYNARRPT